MARRSRAREVALQVLYQDDLNPQDDPSAGDRLLARRLRRPEALQFGRSLVAGVREHRAELDRVIAAVAENWSLGRMAVTDRNLLRLGAYEIRYGKTPGPVAINEAVELAKRYGTPQSAQFVNGILDRLVREQQAAGSRQQAAESGKS
jgi:N utilization substance protein B